MSDDRRTARRVRLPGVDVTYESATGERQQARVIDLSKEGLFIPSPKPLAVGKRLALEIQPVGDVAAWSALGRVVWNREVDDGEERPAGMAVKIIDAEDAVLAAIEHLLDAREPTERGLGFGDAILPVRTQAPSTPPPEEAANPPAREKTVLGIGMDPGGAPIAPILLTSPGREPTLVGVGTADSEGSSREASLAIDLVAKKPSLPSDAPSESMPEPPKTAEASTGVEPAPRRQATREPAPSVASRAAPPARSGRGGLILLVIVAACAIAGFVYRDQVLALWNGASGMTK